MTPKLDSRGLKCAVRSYKKLLKWSASTPGEVRVSLKGLDHAILGNFSTDRMVV